MTSCETYFGDVDRFTSAAEHLYAIETHIVAITPCCQDVDDKVLPSRQLRNYKFISGTQNKWKTSLNRKYRKQPF